MCIKSQNHKIVTLMGFSSLGGHFLFSLWSSYEAFLPFPRSSSPFSPTNSDQFSWKLSKNSANFSFVFQPKSEEIIGKCKLLSEVKVNCEIRLKWCFQLNKNKSILSKKYRGNFWTIVKWDLLLCNLVFILLRGFPTAHAMLS